MKTDRNGKWRSTGGISGNQILEGTGFFISYASGAGLRALSLFGSDGGGDETALVVPRKGEPGEHDYHILNGDYRAAYERLAPEGFDACKKFYDQQSAHADSSWSPKRAGSAS